MPMNPATKWSLLGLVIVLIPVLLLAVQSWMSRPPANLGPVDGQLRPCPDKPNCVCSTDVSQQAAIGPIPWAGDPVAGLEKLRRIISRLPLTQVGEIQDDKYLHAEFTSAMFRFVDDVEFLADPDAKVIHVRSASRVGHSDLGVNRKRVEDLRQAFAAEK